MENVSFSAQIILGFITIIGAGVASYVGIRVALAENKRDIRHLGEEQKRLDNRLDRIDERLDRLKDKMLK